MGLSRTLVAAVTAIIMILIIRRITPGTTRFTAPPNRYGIWLQGRPFLCF